MNCFPTISNSNANPCLNQDTDTWEHRSCRNSISLPWSIKYPDWSNITKSNLRVRKFYELYFISDDSQLHKRKFQNLDLWSSGTDLHSNCVALKQTSIFAYVRISMTRRTHYIKSKWTQFHTSFDKLLILNFYIVLHKCSLLVQSLQFESILITCQQRKLIFVSCYLC